MRANELRIGNYVDVYLPPQISEWIETKVDLNVLHAIIENPTTHGYKPIQLTEEWLLKFGFEEHKKRGISKYWNDFEDLCILVHLVDEDFYFYVNNESYEGETLRKIEHVHTLQNLYFALTGTELTLNETK